MFMLRSLRLGLATQSWHSHLHFNASKYMTRVDETELRTLRRDKQKPSTKLSNKGLCHGMKFKYIFDFASVQDWIFDEIGNRMAASGVMLRL